ncbi:MAG: TRAM domain-containing protein [Pseudomonadota bacterium]
MANLLIERLGKQADGIAKDASGREVFIPFTLPGETVHASGDGRNLELVEVLDASPIRVEPLCAHFGTCGGCQTQHMPADVYAKWKVAILVDALARENLGHDEISFHSFANAERRKATFSAVRNEDGVVLGFAKEQSHEIINLDMCPVLVPELEGTIPSIRDFASTLPIGKKPVRISVLVTRNGLDVCVDGLRPPADAQKLGLVRKAAALDFARLSVGDEILVETCKPFIDIGTTQVIVPPGGFVQASSSAEAKMAALVCSHLASSKSVADLYCGVGTFALRLAENSKVWALEESSAAVAQLEKAWRETGGKLKQVSVEARNLERRPATFKELKHFEGLVFDPPRAGAELQVQQIAKSAVRRVAAVSCNPTSLARDLAILVNGGFRLSALHAVDQFRFTPHLEVVALLER